METNRITFTLKMRNSGVFEHTGVKRTRSTFTFNIRDFGVPFSCSVTQQEQNEDCSTLSIHIIHTNRCEYCSKSGTCLRPGSCCIDFKYLEKHWVTILENCFFFGSLSPLVQIILYLSNTDMNPPAALKWRGLNGHHLHSLEGTEEQLFLCPVWFLLSAAGHFGGGFH